MSTQLLAERYELRDTLGTGGMARVLEGYDRVLDRRVAVKLLREDAGGPQSQERFLREARAAASFHHPNAVAVFDTGRDGGTPFIVMELVEGPTLADVIDEGGALEPNRALDIADEVLSALAEAHRRGLVHRDVKPGNIMLPHHGQAKLTDFGIAKSVRDTAAGLTAAGQVFGTPKYLSPEQVNGQQATPRSDVYAMGVVLYEMLTGEPPFTGENAIAVAIAHTEDEPARLDRIRQDLDPAIVAFVHRTLEKDPVARFSDAGEMRDALRQAREGIAPPYAPTRQIAEPTRRVAPAAATTRVLEQEPQADTGARPPAKPRRGGRLWLWVTVAALLLLAVVVGGAWVADRLGDLEPADEPVEEEPAEPAEPEEPAAPEEEAPDDPVEEAPEEAPPADDPEPPADPPADEAPPEDPPEDAPAEDPDPPADSDPPAEEDEAPDQSRPTPGGGNPPPGQSDAPGQSERAPADPAPTDPVDSDAETSAPPEPSPPAQPAAGEQERQPVAGS